MTQLTLRGRVASVEDISTDEVIAHRLSLYPDGGMELTCISFDYELPFSRLIGKQVQMQAFVDEVPHPEDRYNKRELIVTRVELDDHMRPMRNQTLLQLAS